MKYKLMLYLHTLIFALLFTNCSVPFDYSDPLPSWNDGITKSSIIEFVNDITDKNSPNFIKEMNVLQCSIMMVRSGLNSQCIFKFNL